MHTVITCSPTHVTIARDRRDLTVPWREITGAHAYCLDLMTRHATMIGLEHESGHVLEIWSDAEGWLALIHTLAVKASTDADALARAIDALDPQSEPLILFSVAARGDAEP